MQNRRYRVKTPTVAIDSSDGQRKIVTVPIDVIVTIFKEQREGDRLIDVTWNGKNYLMFAQDLRDRCDPLDD